MAKTIRISTVPSEFDDFMNRTDDYQLEVITPPSTKRYTLWGWIQQESDDWTAFRIKSNILFALMSDPDTTGPTPRKKMRDHIKFVRAYDNNKIVGHHLLDKIAATGNIDDFKKFNIKHGSTLEADPEKKQEDIVLKPPVISLKDLGVGYHFLDVSYPNFPDSKALPKDVKEAIVFRFIGNVRPSNLKMFEQIGSVKRGLFTSTFSDYVAANEEKVYAWYYVRFMNSKGELLVPGPVLRVDCNLVSI
jgi:hypothetical protein